MDNVMTFPDTVEEFMEQYKITDTEHIYSNGMDMVPLFRMRQWFWHVQNMNVSNMKLIDRNALKSKIHYTDDFYETPFVEWDDIAEQPTVDAVPVIRCRECEHGEYDDAIEDEYCYHCRYDGFSYNKADHFCSDGERKGGDE